MSKILGIIGFLISIIGFALDLDLPDWLHGIFVIFSFITFGIAVILESLKYFKTKPYTFNRLKNIEYMEKMIKSEGRVIIFAGKLSWVDNESIKNAILSKKGELYLCVNNKAPYIDEFKKAGVNVLTYGDDDFSPNTHFTIIRQKTPNEKIAITSIEDAYNKEKRLVYELQKNNDDFISNWIMYAATDLFELTKIVNKKS